jgi:Methane oxygenase PmoA
MSGNGIQRENPQRPGVEPAVQGLNVVHEEGRSLRIRFGAQELARYVYGPWDPQLESPRPYFHPLRTLGGSEVSLYRPHDHVWHKGIAWSLPNISEGNFWGGATYTRGRGYEQLDNNGSMVHTGFSGFDVDPARIRITEDLVWNTQQGERWFEETRTMSYSLSSAGDSWILGYSTEFTNVSNRTLTIGSPTTQGRENAGYGGLFWRGPRSFSGGTVYAPGVAGGDELMGIRAPWLGFSGKHDSDGGESTLVFLDSPADGEEHNQWFVRTGIFAVVAASPFFSEEKDVEPGETLAFDYAVAIADGNAGIDGCEELAAEGRRALDRTLTASAVQR